LWFEQLEQLELVVEHPGSELGIQLDVQLVR
jgi:hypothetical protein